ncbi:MAG TPA: hypothetical protein DCO77_04585, partial [Nitrospiraceae bacterium]|nr:hypothetical protein [Nitrospiraceae bacterium]
MKQVSVRHKSGESQFLDIFGVDVLSPVPARTMYYANRIIFSVLVLCIVHAGMAASVHGEGLSPDTQGVFGRYSDRVGKIRVVEVKSGAKSGIGSGFFVSAEGHILTNYHVVSTLIHHPERYRAEFIDSNGDVYKLSVAGVDVVNDLAITLSATRPSHYFRLAPAHVSQGARLYSLGYPHDIGISIVEGTYNGFLKNAFNKKIHFTGSINPGMSGGPAITASGTVVGINVATAGNQVSFLVPVKKAFTLFKATSAAGSAKPGTFLDDVRSQLLSHQDAYMPDDLVRSGKTMELGKYELPGRLAPFFNCWADSADRKKYPYQVVTHQCSTNDVIYISGTHKSGSIKFQHRLITTDKLNRFRFHALYSEFFRKTFGFLYSTEEEVTRYRCKTDTVEHGGIPFKTLFCARSYRKLPGLYDVVFKAAVLGQADRGLETTLVLSGV